LASFGALLLILIALAVVIPDTEKNDTTDKPQPAATGVLPSPSYRAEIDKYNEYEDKKVADIREISKDLALQIATGFAAENEVPKDFFDTFYRCMGVNAG